MKYLQCQKYRSFLTLCLTFMFSVLGLGFFSELAFYVLKIHLHTFLPSNHLQQGDIHTYVFLALLLLRS